jgi:protein tyrosine phosphatase (PTP) superfamily phosphohydrolase (DUF442 family)
MRVRRVVRRVVLAALAVVSPFAAYYVWDQAVVHNFGAVEAGRVYRSGQMPAGDLTAAIRGHKIKTVVNLRGVNPRQAWYRQERAATTGAGATQVDLSLSSCEWMSRAQLREVVRVLDSADYPVLIHCQHGSERTGWVSAVATLLRPGATLADAEGQFSAAYLFARVGDGKVMAEHLDQYEAWLRSTGTAHTPTRFRQWVDQGYQPGTPNREQWPYDPYPLVVITRPEAAGASAVAGADTGTKGVAR